MSELNSGNEPNGEPTKKRRRFESLTHKISDELWARIMKLSVQMKLSPKVVYDRLVLQVADAEVRFLIVKPQNGENAGVTMSDVAARLVATSMALRDTIGLARRYGNPDTAAKLEKAYRASLELWSAAQRLAKETFYTPADFNDMCAMYSMVGTWRKTALKNIDDEQKKAEIDQTQITALKGKLEKWEAVIRVLKRLGCGGQNEN